MPPTKSKKKGIPVSNKDNKSNTKALVADEENVNLSDEEKVDSKSIQVGTKKKGIPVSNKDNKSSTKALDTEEENADLSDEEKEDSKSMQLGTKKKTGKKGNLSDGSKDETKKKPKSKGATKNITMDQIDDKEPHTVDDNKDFDKNETVQVKKHPKKNLKGKSKIQDMSDDGLHDNSENIVPKKKPRNAILNADNSGAENNSDEEIPFDENDVPNHPKETDEFQVSENENNIEEFNLNKTYVLPPRVTRSTAKKTNLPLDLPVDGVTNKVNDLKLNKNKSKQKTKKVLPNVQESGE